MEKEWRQGGQAPAPPYGYAPGRDGICLALAKGFRRVVVETDSLELVSLWKNRRQQRSEVAVILHDIHELVMDLDLFD
jgi:hypothetical protein